MSRGERRATTGWPVRLAACAAIVLGSAGIASAQEIEPHEFVPAPDGTSINLGYFVYGDNTKYVTPSGENVSNSHAQLYDGVERFVHYDYLFGHPAGFQLIESFGSLNDPTVGGDHLGTAGGASNVDLSAFFWPIANFQKRQYLVIAAFLYPPVGTYDKNRAVNYATLYQASGEYNWTGDVQVGWDQGITEHFSYDIGVDGRFFGETTGPLSPGSGIPVSVLTHHNADFRAQVWLNYDINRAMTASVGYEGFFGGLDYFSSALTGTVDTGKSNEQRLRAAFSMFVSPRAQVVLEVNHDVARTGGFQQTFGLLLRGLYIF